MALLVPFAVTLVRGGDGSGILADDWRGWGPWVLIAGGALALATVVLRLPAILGRGGLVRLAGAVVWPLAAVWLGFELRDSGSAVAAWSWVEALWAGALLAVCVAVALATDATREDVERGVATEVLRREF